MKKILFVSTSDLNTNNFAGDAIRANNIINYLKKKNYVDVISLTNFKKKIIYEKKGSVYFFKKYNFFIRVFYSLIFLLKLKPLQLGFFYSKDIKEYLKKHNQKYHTIIFHLMRGAQFLPTNYKGKKILEMTDLMSNNYKQTLNNLNLFNPMYYLYFLESFLIKKYESKCLNLFDKIVLVTKKDLINNFFLKKKIKFIKNGIDSAKKVFKHKETNYKIIFIGNINYLPNKLACLDFSKNVLPKLNKLYSNIEFHIIGKLSFLNNLNFIFKKNVKTFGSVAHLQKNLKNAICGISNLKISTGSQIKVLTYASYGLPIISSTQSAKRIEYLKHNKDFLKFAGNEDLIKKISLLKKNKLLSNKLSLNSYNVSNKLNWDNVLKQYENII